MMNATELDDDDFIGIEQLSSSRGTSRKRKRSQLMDVDSETAIDDSAEAAIDESAEKTEKKFRAESGETFRAESGEAIAESLEKEGESPNDLIMDSDEIDIREIQKIRELGRGSSGVTYLATHPARPNESLVLKVIPKRNMRMRPEKIARVIEHEVSILRYLQDDCELYTICFVDFQDDNENYYILTVYNENFIDLEDYITRHTDPIPFATLAVIMRNLIEALMYLHQKGIFHRDIKPSNILINPDTKQVKIIDFGLACRSQELDENESNLKCLKGRHGSPIYMSPAALSQRENEILDEDQYINNDIWGLGMVLHDLLTVGHLNRREPKEYWDIKTLADLRAKVQQLANKRQRGFRFEHLQDDPLIDLLRPMLNFRRISSLQYLSEKLEQIVKEQKELFI